MGGVDVVGMFRAVAGSDESIGYAVLNREGTGLEKAAAHRHLTGRNVTPAPSDDHASVRYMLYSALKEGVAGQQHAEQFLGMAREKLGITQENGVLTFSNTPLERRSIRVVLQAFDSIATGSGALTKEESALAGLFSMANFANEKTPAPELYKFASSVHDVMTGKTALERAEVGGVSVVVCKAGDGKVGVFFGSGYREIKMNPDFFRGVQKNAFAHFGEFTPASVGRILASFADKVNIPLSADAQHVRELCRSMVLAKFPAGVDVVRLDNLSPSSMLHLAGEIARGAITKPETLMQAVGQFDGQLNSITGENRAPGGRNELGGTMDKNINSQENDYLVERFLKSSEEDQNNVQFSEECDRPVKLSKTMSNEEIDKFIGPYKKDLSVGGVVKDKVVGVIQGFASLFKSTYSEDDVAALTEMLGKPEAEPPQENGFFGAVGGFFKGFGLFGKPAEEPKKAEAKPAEEKKAEPPEDTLFELSVDDGKGGKETKFVTASNLKTVAKLMCEAGEDDKHLDELKGGLSTRAKAFANAFRADPRLRPLLDSCQSGNEAEFEKDVMSLCRPFDGEAGDKLRMALDAFDDQAEAWTKDDLAMFTLSNKSNAAVLAKLLSVRASGLFDVAKLDPAIAPKAQKLLALFDGLKAEYADEAGKKHPLSDLYANRRALELEIRRLGSSGLNEHDVAEIRDAFADLLQDSNTWETDKLKDVPGARLSYSLNKNAEAMAAFLCNRHQVGIFGFPTSIFAKALLENLDAFPKNMMDEVFVPGNEQDAAQALRAMLTQSGVKAALAVAEQKIDEQAEVTCKELQVVTSSQFTAMLSGAGGDVDADKIRESFGWLRGLLARTPAGADANGNVSKQCDVAMDFLKGLTGRTAPEFEKVFKQVFPDVQGTTGDVLLSHLNEVRDMLNDLGKCAVSDVDQLILAHELLAEMHLQSMGGDVELAKENPVTLKDTMLRIVKRMPAGTTVADLRMALAVVRAEKPGVVVMADLDDAVALLANAPLPHGATFADLRDLAQTLPAPQGENGGNERFPTLEVLKRLPEGRTVADFRAAFASEVLGHGDVEATFAALAKMKPEMAVADVEHFMQGGIPIETAVERLGNLPSDKTVADVVVLTTALGCTELEAMKALRKVDRGLTTNEIAETLKHVIELGGKEGDANRLTVDDALKILMSGGKGKFFLNTLSSFENTLAQTDWESAGMQPPSSWEKLLMAVQLAQGGEKLRTNIDAAVRKQEGEEELTPAALARVLAVLPEPADVEVGQAKNKFTPTVRKLNTQFPADARYHVLVQMLRDNGMNEEADAIDVVVEDPPPGDDSRAHKEAVESKRKEIEKLRMEYSRQLLNKLGTSATDVTKGYGKFMCEVMNNYFASVSTLDMRTMLASSMRYATGEDPVALLGATLKGAGPIMQKMLQGLASIRELPKSFLDALSDMRSNLADIPQTLVRAQLHELVLQSNGKIESIRVVKPLGAASVGQAFFCELKMAGEEKPRNVVVKMLRPDAMPRAQREKDLFLQCARNVPGMEKTFEGQLKGIMDELDLTLEAGNVRTGQVYGLGAEDIGSMKLIDGVPLLKNMMVVERAPGTTVDRYADEVEKKLDGILSPFRKEDGDGYALKVDGSNFRARATEFADTMQKLSQLYSNVRLQQERLVELARKWANEGIYNGGFYHGDLHAGNIMVSDPEVGEDGIVRPGKLTVIDFGNATQLTKDQQKAIIRMMSAASVKDTNRFLDNFAELMSPAGRADFAANRDKGKRLHDMVHDILNLGDQNSTTERIFAILQQLMLVGYEMPPSVYSFSQCALRLQGTIDQMNKTTEKIRAEMIKFARCRTGASGRDRGFFEDGNPIVSFLAGKAGSPDPSNDPSLARRFANNCGNSGAIKNQLVDSLAKALKNGPAALDNLSKMFDDCADLLPDGATVVEGENNRLIKSGAQIKEAFAGLRHVLESDAQFLEKLEKLRTLKRELGDLKKENDTARQKLQNVQGPLETHDSTLTFAPMLLKNIRQGGESLDSRLQKAHVTAIGSGELSEEELRDFGDKDQIRGLYMSSITYFREGYAGKAQQKLADFDFGAREKTVQDLVDAEKASDDVYKAKTAEVDNLEAEIDNFIKETFNPQIEAFSGDFADFFHEGFYLPMAEKLETDVPDEANSQLSTFFSAIGDTIGDHINQDLFNLDFSSFKQGLFSIGKLVKSLPSVVENLNRFGPGLVYKTMKSSGEVQVPV